MAGSTASGVRLRSQNDLIGGPRWPQFLCVVSGNLTCLPTSEMPDGVGYDLGRGGPVTDGTLRYHHDRASGDRSFMEAQALGAGGLPDASA
jgi:hypothetical protein